MENVVHASVEPLMGIEMEDTKLKLTFSSPFQISQLRIGAHVRPTESRCTQ